MSTMPLSRNWGHLGVVNAAQFALMSAAQFAQQQIIVDQGDGTQGSTYISDGAFWQPVSTGVVVYTPGQAAAAANTTLLQSRLNTGGSVQITTPGICYINAVLLVPSNTSVYIGPGVTLKVADGARSAVFTNSAARGVGTVATAANVSYASAPSGFGAGSNNYCATIANMTAAEAARFPVGSWVSAVVLGHGALGVKGTAWNNRGYRGVWRVIEQTINGAASSIKYLILPVYPGSAPASNNVTLYPADENIKIWGPGTIDGNGANALTTAIDGLAAGVGNPQSCVMWWRHCYNLTVEGLSFRRGLTWTVGSNYVRNYIVRSITSELRLTPTFSTIDLVHLSGNHQNVLICDVDGGAGDNGVGMTIDCTEGTAYDFAYQHPGDMSDVTISHINAESICEDGSFGIVAMYGPEAYWYHNLVIDGVTGTGASALQCSVYATTNQNKLMIDRLVASNLRAFCGSGQVEFTASAIVDIGDMILDGVNTPREDVAAYNTPDTATGNIRSLVLRNLTHTPYNGTTFTRSAEMARFGGINLGALQIANSEGIVMGANVKCFSAQGPANIPKIGIRDSSATGSGTAHLWGDTGGGTAAAPVYNNATYNGTPL